MLEEAVQVIASEVPNGKFPRVAKFVLLDGYIEPVIIRFDQTLFDTTTSQVRHIPTAIETDALGIEPYRFSKSRYKREQGPSELVYRWQLLKLARIEAQVPAKFDSFRVQMN